MPADRDPISKWFDPAARRLLTRAYASPGAWVGVFVAPPSPRQRAMAALEHGIWNLGELDRGEPRWIRAFKRSAYWHLRYYGRAGSIDFSQRRAAAGYDAQFAASLEWQTGKRVMRSGWPTRRWAVRVRLHTASAAAAWGAQDRAARGKWADGMARLDQRDWG